MPVHDLETGRLSSAFMNMIVFVIKLLHNTALFTNNQKSARDKTKKKSEKLFNTKRGTLVKGLSYHYLMSVEDVKGESD